MLDWCADRLLDDPMLMAMGIMSLSPTVDIPNNRILIQNASGEAYMDLAYENDGILKTGVLYNRMVINNTVEVIINYSYMRIFDFNPYDNIEWALDIGDQFYVGVNENETRVEIIEIRNNTALMNMSGQLLYMYTQAVYAQMSVWTGTSWVMTFSNISIGSASEIYPFMPTMGPTGPGPSMMFFPLLIPKGSSPKDVSYLFSMFTIDPSITLTYSEDGFTIYNITSGGKATFQYFANGICKYLSMHDFKMFYPMGRLVIYYKNWAIINGDYGFFIDILSGDITDIDILVNISVSADTLLLFSGFPDNPFNETLEDALIFIDVMVNDTNNLVTTNGAINITFDYDPSQYEDIAIWYFNTTSMAWEEVPYIILGSGKIMITVNHSSIFAVAGSIIGPPEIPEVPDEEPMVPFGFTFILFAILSMIGIIIYTNKKYNKIIN